MTLVINLYGGPGTGKSTTTAELFAKLKQSGINCEIAREYAKEEVWAENFKVFKDHLWMFSQQYHRIFNLLGQVEVILTDNPLLHDLHYGAEMPQCFSDLVIAKHNETPSVNIFLRRVKEYNPAGRFQTEIEAKAIDDEMLKILNQHCPGYLTFDANIICASNIMEYLIANKLIFPKVKLQ